MRRQFFKRRTPRIPYRLILVIAALVMVTVLALLIVMMFRAGAFG